tara:strand:- start:321 stop:650 length:330 start_codon:yes stop_codon:yes gene_type:complete
MIIVKKLVDIIIITRIIAIPSSLEKAPLRAIDNPNTANNVKNTAKCAIVLLSFFIPFVHNNSIPPIKVGIKAVIDGVSEEIYPHNDKTIKLTEFIKFKRTLVISYKFLS